MANEKQRTPGSDPFAGEQPATATIGMELICDPFENGKSVVGKVIGKEKGMVRVRIDELGRDWLVQEQRIDLARGTWKHVAADYPAIAEKADFDREFRPHAQVTAEDEKARSKMELAALELSKLLPPEMRAGLNKIMQTTSGKGVGLAPGGMVYARWVGHGVFAGTYLEANTRHEARNAKPGTEGFFKATSVAKYKARGREQRTEYFVEL